ncbi:chloride intracellular channel protein 3 [Bufo gargarizans]|uniref:chloride intracellular channel protein 3 n=1 Tax=Bufo gargarizans TaxID=30331 RepID=UPI001CF2B795|nr:chloride intracellular channel protein 3 [Bufo gargarizans]
MVDEPKIELFVKSSEDGESIGANPFSQRLAMILMFKGCTFTLNTVDMKRAPDVLKILAPGTQPPFLIHNNEVKTDVNSIEEFLEETLTPPRYPSMAPKYKESNTVGNDVFQKFSAYIKNQSAAQEDNLQKNLLRSLLKLDVYLMNPLPHELAADPKMAASKRKFLDGDNLTLPDCNLLPKLHIINVVCRHYRKFEIPKDLQGISRYLQHAEDLKAFKYTCPNASEIILFYRDVVRKMP